MGGQPEAAVITRAMLEEEEQLEAAGLERERKMLEKVRPHWPRGPPALSGWRSINAVCLQMLSFKSLCTCFDRLPSDYKVL
jgi:hypothetical protein